MEEEEEGLLSGKGCVLPVRRFGKEKRKTKPKQTNQKKKETNPKTYLIFALKEGKQIQT